MGAAETWLTPDEVAELTATKSNSYKAQCRRLARMGVPFTPNAIGRPLVLRTVLGSDATPKRKRREPNWEAINGSAA